MRGLGFILRIFLSCIEWCEGCCGTSVGEGTVRGGRLLVVTRCAPYSTAAPVCCYSSQLAGAEDIRNPLRYFLMNRSSISYFYSNSALGGSSYPRLPTGAPLTSPPAACLPSPEIQNGRSQCDVSAQCSVLSTEAYRHLTKSETQRKSRNKQYRQRVEH